MEQRQRGLHCILGGIFMTVIGVLAAAAFESPTNAMGASLSLTGLLVVGYGLWLRR